VVGLRVVVVVGVDDGGARTRGRGAGCVAGYGHGL
jgi:hypothetical protein